MRLKALVCPDKGDYNKIMESKRFMLNYAPEAVKAINQKVNELLLKHDDPSKDMTIDPSVNIMRIAKACGVKKVMCVSPKQLNGEHAVYKDGIVRIDKTDRDGQRTFDLAHEVGHIVFNHITKSIEFKIVHSGSGVKGYFPLFTKSVVYKAARQGTRRKSELPPEERQIEDFFDYFAANLLVPIHRFQLWEDKTDKKIAEAFKVEAKCIRKRRREVEYEMDILTSTMKPCQIKTIIDPNVKLDVEAMLREVNG
jgi:Zn-dependent peptidase ImmA (M78 family)